MNKRRRGWAVVSDFDGTVTTFDVGDALCLHFGAVSKRDVERSYLPGVRVEQWMASAFARLGASKKEVERFASGKVRPRAGFLRLARACARRGMPFEIASGGIDLYIRPVLDKWGLGGIPVYCGCGKAARGGFRISYPMLKEVSLARFKARRVRALQNKGYRVIFCGDGTGDFLAARAADEVFARYKLLARCREFGVSARKLTDFGKVLDFALEGGCSR